MRDEELKQYVDLKTTIALSELFSDVHVEAGTTSGDIYPEQQERLNKIIEDLQNIIFEQVTQNQQ